MSFGWWLYLFSISSTRPSTFEVTQTIQLLNELSIFQLVRVVIDPVDEQSTDLNVNIYLTPNKKYDFSGGKLKYDESEIKDIWKSNYKIKQGDKEQMFYHSKDFGNQVIKMLPNIKKNKDFI